MVTLAQFKSKLLSLLREDFYTKTEIDTKENTINSILANKVDTEGSKGLSTEDYTTEEKIKLSKLKEIEMIDDISEIEGDGTFFLIDEESNIYTISLSANKDIISSGETVDITATLLMNSLPLSNKEILFDDGTSQINITTDSNGEAVYTYTGTGAGDVNIIASWNMLLQETFVLWDCIFYDCGVTGSKNPNWNNTGNMLVETTNNGTTITTDGTTTGSYTENQIWLTGDFKVTVEVNTTDTVRLGFIVGTRSTRVQLSYDSLWEITRVNGVYTFMRSMDNGESWSELSSRDADVLTTEDCRFYFYIPVPSGSARSLTYKNLKIYSI